MFREGDLEKKYWAITANRPQQEAGELVHHLYRNEQQNKSYAYDRDRNGSKEARLKYKVIAKGDRYNLIEVELLTGRHHQIRCQLAAIGCPIKGDLKYGSPRSNRDGSISLHSRSVKFIHPVKKTEIFITATPPKDPLWDFFVRATE